MAIFLGDGDNSWTGTGGPDGAFGEGGDDHLQGLADDDTLDGGGADDTLEGNGGNDVLVGGDGVDILLGHAGDDYLRPGNVLQSEVAFGYGGFDIVDWGFTAGATWVINLGKNLAVANGSVFQSISSIEGVVTGDGDDSIVGSKADNDITSGHGADTVRAGAGDDWVTDYGGENWLVLGDGDDTANLSAGASFIECGLGDDSVWSGSGDDTIKGGEGGDTLRGYTGFDIILGGKGADRISGEGDADLLFGGRGADTFVINDWNDSSVVAADMIDDWDAADVLDLSGIDAREDRAGNEAFRIVDAFTGSSGQLMIRYDAVDDTTIIEGDVWGDGVADLRVEIFFDVRDTLEIIL